MPEPATTVNNQPTPPTGTDPKPPANADPNFDSSKLTDDQLAKLYEDPRLYKHPRFKELTEAKQERDKLAAEKKQREEDELKQKGEYEKLAQLAQKERDDVIAENKKLRVDTSIERQALKQGAVDSEAVLALIDRSKVTVDDKGELQGVEEAVKALQASKPFLFGTGSRVTVGNPTNPANPNSGQRYKHSQLMDPKFFREHEADIRLAIKEGRVENDL